MDDTFGLRGPGLPNERALSLTTALTLSAGPNAVWTLNPWREIDLSIRSAQFTLLLARLPRPSSPFPH